MVPAETGRHSYVEAARALAPLIAEAAGETEARRELPERVVDALADAGLWWLLIPRSLGGAELDLPTYVEVIEEVAKADASTAWCLNQGTVFATHSAYLPPKVAREIWSDRRSVVANGPAPTAKAVAVDGGYRVTGRWTFSSGCRHATWLAGFAPVFEDDKPRYRPDGLRDFRYLLMPAGQAEILDVWHVRGLRGTGSNHFAITDLFIPGERSVWAHADPPREPGPLYVVPLVHRFAVGFASVATGTARAALDALIDLAGGKTPRAIQGKLRDQGLVQAEVGRAEAQLMAARSVVRQTLDEVWEAVRATGAITLDQRMRLRLATTHAIHLAIAVVDTAYDLAGATAVYDGDPIQRRFQDIHVLSQHVQARASHYETTGQFFLGLEPADLQWI